MHKEVKQSKLRVFLSYYRPHMKYFLLDMLCAVMIAGVDLAFPMVTRYSIQNLLPDRLYRAFFLVIGILVAAYLFRMAMQYFVNYIGHYVGVLVEADMRRDVFSHIQKLSFRYFDNVRTGHLMSRITNDLFEITELAHHGPEDLLISAVMLVGSFILLCTINWKLALVLFIMIPIIVLFTMRQRKRMSDASKEVKKKMASINGDIESSISGVRVSKAFSNEGFEIEKFDAGNETYKMARKTYFKSMGYFHSGMEFMTSMLYVVVLLVGGVLIMRGEMDVIELITFNLYVSSFLQPIRKMANFMEQYTAGMAGFERMQELMGTEPDIVDKKGAKELKNVTGKIAFEHVSFSYDGKTPVLQDVSFTIEPGRKAALVGPSGGGKSTLCQLLPRFYEVCAGRITIDGSDIREFTLRSLRDQIGIVQQDVFLFAASVRDNIRYGKLDATNEEIVEAAKRAEIHDFILSLPNGYDTYVGERGVLLSGGQKQRISIARIFLKNPPILILDEATSALDTETELKIQSSLNALSEGRTSLVIAHRLSTIQDADEIIVIDDDRIVERGTHESLLQTPGGIYASLYSAQFHLV